MYDSYIPLVIFYVDMAMFHMVPKPIARRALIYSYKFYRAMSR